MPGSGLRSWEARQVASVQSPRTPRAAWLMSGAEPMPLATARSLQKQESGAEPAPTLLGAPSGMGSGLQGALAPPGAPHAFIHCTCLHCTCRLARKTPSLARTPK